MDITKVTVHCGQHTKNTKISPEHGGTCNCRIRQNRLGTWEAGGCSELRLPLQLTERDFISKKESEVWSLFDDGTERTYENYTLWV